MIKLSFLIFLLFSSTFANSAEDCTTQILSVEDQEMITELTDAIRDDVKRRPPPFKSYHSLINIEANFSAPFVGKDKYFGRIYIVDGQPNVVKYRDEMIAQNHLSEEMNDEKTFYISEYKIQDINSIMGLSLVKGAGAEVTLKSTNFNFNTTTGGRLSLKVKGPGDDAQNLTIDIKITNGKASNFLVIGNRSIPFDTMKINAEHAFLTGTSALNGIENLEFTKNGTKTYSLKM